MLEIEMKFAVPSFAAVESCLRRWQARADAPRIDSDRYFNAPDRDFARTDEALRIRTIGSASFVTYKGPKLDAQTKTRTEIEVPLAAGAAESFAALLGQLGYRPVREVRKQRRVYHLERGGFAVEVCLDEVDGLGSYVELEILAPAAQLDAARGVLQELAVECALTQAERRSYLEMLLTRG